MGRAAQIPEIGNGSIVIARDEIFWLAGLGIKHRALHRADIGTIDMDADAGATFDRIFDAMRVVAITAQHNHFSALDAINPARAHRSAIRVGDHFGGDLLALMHTNQAPDGVVMHWRLLPWAPDETHYGKPLLRVAMQ